MSDPTIILSLGKMGAEALCEIEQYIAPNSHIQFAGISYEEPDAYPADMTWYVLDADLSDLEANPHKISDIPDVNDWFDVKQFRESMNQDQTVHNRQLGRLIFYRHMMQRGSELEAYILNLDRLVRQEAGVQTKVTLQVHVLMSMDELEGLAIVLDILNILQAKLARQTPIMLMLHCALPQSAVASHTRATQPHLGAGYAMLRELKRFIVSYGGAMQKLYPSYSPLATLNTDSVRHLASSLKIYAHHRGNVIQQWSDILLAFFEGDEHEFLNFYAQARINVHRSRSNHEDRYALFVGLFEARSAIFPEMPFRKQLRHSLTYDLITRFVGDAEHCQKMTLSQLNDVVEQDWLKKSYVTGDGRRVASPRIALSVLRDEPTLNADTDLSALQDVLDISIFNNDSAGMPVFSWDIHDLTVPKKAKEYVESVTKDLNRLFGSMKGASEGLYSTEVQRIVAEQMQYFDASLQAFILHTLQERDDIQIRCLHRLFKQVVEPAFKNFVRRIDLVWRKQEQSIRQATIESDLDKASRYVKNTHKMFGGVHGDVQTYRSKVTKVIAPLKIYYLWQGIHQFAHHMLEEVERTTERIEKWGDLLWQAPESILMLADERASFTYQNTDHRYWLFDEEWEQEWLTKLTSQHIDTLLEMLQWQIDEQGLLALQLRTTQSDIALVPDSDLAQQYYQQLRAPVVDIVMQQDIALWADYLNADGRMLHHHDRLLEFLTEDRTAWVQEDYDYFLGIPDQMALETGLTKEIGEFVQGKIGKETTPVLVKDGTRLVLLSSYELVPIAMLPAHQNMKASYLEFERGTQAHFHVLRPEVEAIYLQMATKSSLNERIQFTGDIVSLLSYRQRIEDFIYLLALRLIDLKSSHLDQHSYVLYDITGTKIWWLPTRDAGENLYTALETFCLDTKEVKFGDGESSQPLPRAYVTDWIDEAIITIEQETDVTPTEGALWGVVNDLIYYRGESIRPMVRKEGFKAEYLLAIQEKLKRDITDSETLQEYQARVLLVVVAQDMIKNIREILQKLG